jgi:hypothetical protein
VRRADLIKKDIPAKMERSKKAQKAFLWKIREIHDFGPTDEAEYVKKRRRFVFSPRFRLNYKNSINPLKKF